MAHKKGVGSSRNGRDSQPKMLGVKRFSGQWVTGRLHPRPPARHAVLPWPERRPRRRLHAVRQGERRGRVRGASRPAAREHPRRSRLLASAASPCPPDRRVRRRSRDPRPGRRWRPGLRQLPPREVRPPRRPERGRRRRRRLGNHRGRRRPRHSPRLPVQAALHRARGGHGEGSDRHGANGGDLVLRVPSARRSGSRAPGSSSAISRGRRTARGGARRPRRPRHV